MLFLAFTARCIFHTLSFPCLNSRTLCGKGTENIRLCSQHVTKIHSSTLFREEFLTKSENANLFLSSTDGIYIQTIFHVSRELTRILFTTNDCFFNHEPLGRRAIYGNLC